MPVYGQNNPDGSVVEVSPGGRFIHFSGNEIPIAGLRSVAFSRGHSVGGADNGSTWYARGMPSGSVIQICGANTDAPGNYIALESLTPDANGNAYYTDIGRAAYFSVVLSSYTSGSMPIVECQR